MNAESTNAKTPKSPAKSRKAAKPADASALTLKQLAEQYIRDLEREGKSRGTAFSYATEMDLAIAELGAETPVSSITGERVKQFFESDRVCKKRSGGPKALPTISKSRRVLRLALEWAAQKRLIAKSPIEKAAAPRPVKKAKSVAAPDTTSAPKTTTPTQTQA